MGFRLIYNALVAAKKPTIGHNMLYDLLYFMSALHGRLPDTLDEYKTLVNETFPLLFDTKHIQNNLTDIREAIEAGPRESNCLEGLFRYLSDVYPETMFNFKEGFAAYDEEGKAHEAGYDAYITGASYLLMSTHNEVSENLNMVCIGRSIYVMNMQGSDVIDSGDILYVTHHHFKVRAYFDNDKDVQVRTLSATAFLLISKDTERTSEICKTLSENHCKVIPYAEFKNNRKKKK